MPRHQQTSTSFKTTQENTASPNKLSEVQGASSTETEICDLSDREFKIAVLRKLKEIQYFLHRGVQNPINKFHKEIEIVKKNQAEILELKIAIEAGHSGSCL